MHPALEPILRETCGGILYQEQVLRIAHEVAAMLAQLEQERWHGRHTGQIGLLAVQEMMAMPDPTYQERADWERQVLGICQRTSFAVSGLGTRSTSSDSQ